jgi:ComF family protein
VLSVARFVYAYRRPVSGMIRRMKYQGVLRMADWMAKEIGEAVRRELPGRSDAIAFVPMHKARRRLPGGNHAEAIARALAPTLGVPCVAALMRTRETRQQARLGGPARRRNLEGAFRASDVRGLRILLVDDVLTTGATALACARALYAAGASDVQLIALAGAIDRVPPQKKE